MQEQNKPKKEYTVKAFAELSGITPRTLRYYDGIGLLKPSGLSPSGYRLYGAAEVDSLQQILFYRALGMPLEEISKTLHSQNYDQVAALKDHLSGLCARRKELDCLIDTVAKTIASKEGKIYMTDKEKFQGFLKEQVDKNEETYGAEIRKAYGEDVITQANAKMMGLSQEEFTSMQNLDQEIREALEKAVGSGQSPDSEEGLRIANLHKEWLSYTWPAYTPAAHAGLAEGYVSDERFTAYYDRTVAGCAVFLRDAILAMVGPLQDHKIE